MAGRMPGGRPRRTPRGRDSRAVAGVMVLAALTIITVDAQGDEDGSPVDPLRSAAAAVLGPTERAATAAFDPVISIPEYFRDVDDLRAENARLRVQVTSLQRERELVPELRARRASTTGVRALATQHGYDVREAHVIGVGPGQSFRRTVTIDVGRQHGVVPDQMVIASEGLVGRVVASGPTTSTVLLIIDRASTIGGRISGSSELGFLDGDGSWSSDARLTLKLVDHQVTPRKGDPVLTWGSRNGAPYLPDVPVGWVDTVRASPADLTETARVVPYVDFSSLDVVGVVTGNAATSRHEAGGQR